MPLVYATADQLEAWLQDDVPDNADTLLRSASGLVRRATASDYYDVDGAGKPSDATILQAFTDATCAQAACWIALGIDPVGGSAGALGVTGAVVSSKLLSGSVQYDTTPLNNQAVINAKQQAATELCDAAIEILQEADLLRSGVWVYG